VQRKNHGIEGKTARHIKRKEMVVVDEILMTSCSTLPRPYYETPEGRKKLKYYNAIQFGHREIPPFSENAD
jgi:hypothetical protein